MSRTERLAEIIEQKRDLFIRISDEIWDYAETRYEEFKSAKLLCDTLENEGFHVEKGAAGIETAFVGSWGSGKPVVAILGEYDALFGLSQHKEIAVQSPVDSKISGHGCGHNLLGTGALAAAVALRQYAEENQLPGTIRYYGCPAEELGSGKTYMARAGLFNDVDFALTWHPAPYHGIMPSDSLANYQVYYKFKGRSTHAAGSPHLGRSALDAVELMNVGSNYLREHIIPEARVHYAVLNTGGNSPNVVQGEAEVLYMMRAPKIPQVQDIYERVSNIARGAALMTDTKVEIVFDKACSNLVRNTTLDMVMHRMYTELGVPGFDEHELQVARDFRATLTEADKQMKQFPELSNKELADVLLPYRPTATMSASTDVGDVSWITPTAECYCACTALGTPFHSWQMVAQGTTSFAHKGMLHAGKVIAATAVELMQNPELLAKAKVELKERLDGDVYVCPIPQDVQPAVQR